jgi:fucose permease
MKKEEATNRVAARWTTALFFVLSGLITASWASRIPHLQQQLALSNAAWGTVLFMAPVGQAAGLFVAGWLTARFGVRHTMVAATVFCALVLVLAGASNVRLALMATLFALGFGRTVLNLAVNTRAAEVQQLYAQPITANFHGLWSLACFAAAGFGTLMIVAGIVPVRHFGVVAIVCMLAALAFQVGSKKERYTPPANRPLFVKPDRYLGMLGGICFCSMLAENVLFDWSVNYFTNAVHAPRQLETAGYTGFILAMTVGRLLGDRVVSKLGAIRVITTLGIMLTAGFLVAACFPQLVPAVVGFVLIGLGNSIMVPIVYVLASRHATMPPAYALSAVTLIGYIGFLLGPLLVGAVSDALNMQWALGLVGIMGLGIVVLAQKIDTARPH